MNILIVEDEQRLADFLVRGLRAEGHVCEVAADGEAGLDRMLAGDYDLVVLDRMLPRRDGLSVLKSIKARRPALRVLMLTALDEIDDRVMGLRSGADDYLGKPFDFDELLARVEALGRRDGAPDSSSGLIELHGVRLDIEGRQAWCSGRVLTLTQIEFEVLRLFIQQAGKALSRERILSRVWGQTEDPLTNIVDVYVRRLRVKLGDESGELIETVRGVGYRFRAGN